MKHCCEEMDFHINERERIIKFCAQTRTYGIKVDKYVRQTIHYCPWCGTKLPEDLTDELCKIIFDDLKFESLDDKGIPKEFKTDEWWKKRGL